MVPAWLTTLVIVVLYTLALTLGMRELLDGLLNLNLLSDFWYRDYVGNLIVSLICLGLTQNVIRTIALSSLFIVIFQLGNAFKLVVLGTPVSPDDFINIKNLFLLVEGWKFWAAIIIAIMPILALLLLTRWRKLTTWLTLVILGTTIPVGALYSAELKTFLDKRFGNSVWNQPENFKRRGLGLHIVQEAARTISKVGQIPSAETVANISVDLAFKKLVIESDNQRNVHMVVLESFFDPNSLGKDWVPVDPFPPEFTALWDSTGRSTALSPVFGGYTANAEFESLCGFPVTENAVFFEGWLRRNVPCLPALLDATGYRSIASHPNVAGFWNRAHAYKLMGFEDYWSKTHFDTSDSVGNFVLDHSYYEQVFNKLEEFDDSPVFNYMLTLHGHLPYPSNENYPDMVDAGKESKLLQGYLNHVYYKSRDLMAMLTELRADDPEALIIIFGDHLPYLGKNYGIYTDIKKMMPDREDFTGEMFEFLSSTPLIIIDGQKGPIDTGQLPLYRLPALILSLLGAPSAGMTEWTKNPADKIIRPIYGMHFYLENNEAIVCRTEDEIAPECAESEQWLQEIKVLNADIFSGKQFSLKQENKPPLN